MSCEKSYKWKPLIQCFIYVLTYTSLFHKENEPALKNTGCKLNKIHSKENDKPRNESSTHRKANYVVHTVVSWRWGEQGGQTERELTFLAFARSFIRVKVKQKSFNSEA